MTPEPKTSAPVEGQVRHCPRCAHPLKERVNFCPHCGLALPSLRSVGVDKSSLRAY